MNMQTIGKLCISIGLSLLILHDVSIFAGDKVYTLQDAYQSALLKNEEVKISEENVLQSESRLDQAWTYLYPRISAHAAYTRYNKSLPPGAKEGQIFQPLGQLQAAVVLTQPLYTGGRTLAGLREARTLRDLSGKDLSTTRQETMLNVAIAYYEVLKAEKMVEKSRDSVQRMERHKKVTEREAATRRTKANISSLLRARTLVSQARITLTRDENGLRIARQRLRLLTKLPEDAVLAEPVPEEQPAGSIEIMTATALANRDDYAASLLNEKVAEENVTVVRGAHYPQAYAEAAYQHVESDPATLIDANTLYAGLRLDIPIFEGGLMKAEVSEARSKQRQAELSSQFLKRQIETDVYESYVNYQTVTSVLDSVKGQYSDAKSNFNAVESMFGQGLVSSLALIDAQQALFLAERELVSATYDQQEAILKLEKSTGLLGKTEQSTESGGNHASP